MRKKSGITDELKTSFDSVQYCRELSGVIMAESIKQYGRTEMAKTAYITYHHKYMTVFNTSKGRRNWTNQLKSGIIELNKIISKRMSQSWLI